MTREEAIKILREAHDNALFSVRTALETLIPELQESDDERMLQTIIRGFENCKRNGMATFNNTKIDDILVYLEKQKEIGIQWLKSDNVKNPDKPYVDKAGMFYTTDGRMCYASEIEKQKEQKPKIYIPKFRAGDEIKLKGSNLDLKITNIEGSRYYGKGWSLDIVSADESYELVEQKSVEINEYEIIKKHITHDVLSSEVNKRLKECEWYVIDEKPAEWDEDYNEENIQTRFAFYTYKDDPCTLYLSNVFVEETSRNKGFGTKILAAAEKVAETFGVTYIRLKVKQNSPANAWYRKNGYGYVAFEDGYNWLEKNLEYMKSQPKQEWSKEDERKYQCIRNILLTDMDKKVGSWKYSEILEWYEKRGIGRYTNSKLHWKPNEEQMEALKNSAYGIYQNGDGPVLRGLYEQLEKL